MAITSFNFFVLLSVILAVFYIIPGRFQTFWLLAASYLFMSLWNWQFALLLAAVTVFHFGYAFLLANNKKKGLLAAGICANVLLLLFFRSANFFIPEFEGILQQLGIETQTGGLYFLLPVGLSYHVLQNISYLVDVYRGQIPPAKNFIHFALYLAYFPKLLAGPIERARTFLPKLAANKTITNEDIGKSITLIAAGLIRKLVIADSLSTSFPDNIFVTPSFFSSPELLGWLVVYAFIIYNDFAGYTSIARGVSALFGIELSINFDYPYFARNFSEFWNRWHITLSHWLRDYIYFPLSRSLLRIFPKRESLVNLIVPPLITMMASGIWHGLSWHMLVWGILHGIFQVAERLINFGRPVVPPDQQPIWRQMFSTSLVFFLVLMAWVPFRMDMPAAVQYWRAIINVTNLNIDSGRLLLILPYIGFWMALDWLLYRKKNEFIWISIPQWARAGLLAAAVLLVAIAASGEVSTPFIYQGF
jgi:alginate O-acetyltransferase complex protein AlgI